jgi:TIR domain
MSTLAPRLEAAGYKVFADILTLEPGDRWRKQVTNTLHNRSVKVLLCCRDVSLAKYGVQEEIGIASDLVKQLPDSRFIQQCRQGDLALAGCTFGCRELTACI